MTLVIKSRPLPLVSLERFVSLERRFTLVLFLSAAFGPAATISLPRLGHAEPPPPDRPIDIDIGSSRIGGAGLTASERKSNAEESDEEEAVLTEQTLPPKGDKKRLPGLHMIAKRYFGGQMWSDAAARYDQILEEGGDEAIDLHPDGRSNASRTFLECAGTALHASDFDLAERLLKKSERFGKSDYRHASIRRRIKREKLHRHVANGDVDSAMALFREFQTEKKDEDERIWMGEEMAKFAWAAYQAHDKIALERMLARATEVAPMNTELRRLKEQIERETNVLPTILGLGVGALALVYIAARFLRWRSAAKIRAIS